MRIKLIAKQANVRRKKKYKKSIYYGVVDKASFDWQVRFLTNQTKDSISKPRGYSNDKFSLDHKLSVHDAFYKPWKNPPSLYEIAHPCNLQYISKRANSVKNSKSSMTLKELRRQIVEYNEIHGDPFENTIMVIQKCAELLNQF